MMSLTQAARRAAVSLLWSAGACGTSSPKPPVGPVTTALGAVIVLPNRDSALITFPAFNGAKDYRAFPKGAKTSIDADGRETVTGSTVFCAGIRQYNAPPQQPEPMLQIQITGLTGPTDFVIEAIDRLCPFPGVLGRTHHDVEVKSPEVEPELRIPFPFVTEAEVTTRYGSYIVNGHGPAALAGQPAPADPPRILASGIVTVTPSGNGAPITKTFFEDFGDPTDSIGYVGEFPDTTQPAHTYRGKVYQSKKLTVYAYGWEGNPGPPDAAGAQVYFDRGQLHTVLADAGQDVFGSIVITPRTPAKLPALGSTSYLHITYEVESNATQRRYWWLSMCGADQVGGTQGPDGKVLGHLIQTPFFYQPDGRNLSAEGWNCFQLFPRGGSPTPISAEDTKNPQSDVRIMVDKAGFPEVGGVVNVSPYQYAIAGIDLPGWYRAMKGGKNVKPILDDQLNISPRTRFDVWLRRDRAVFYVNGEMRACNDFPAVPLTMAEGTIGFGQVLYHSGGERLDLAYSQWLRTGQAYYRKNTPFVDKRSWDNLGYEEGANSPPDLNEAADCYHYAP